MESLQGQFLDYVQQQQVQDILQKNPQQDKLV